MAPAAIPAAALVAPPVMAPAAALPTAAFTAPPVTAPAATPAAALAAAPVTAELPAPPVTAPAATTPAVALALAAAPVTALAAAPVTAPAATFPAAAPPMMTPLAGDSEEEEKQRVFLETWKQVPGDDGRPTQLPNIIDAAFPLTRPDWNFNTPEEAHLQALQLVQREVWKPLAKETSRWCPTPSRSGTPFGSDDTRPRAWNHGGRGPILSC
ncbi:uncharacterized protein LOC143270318 [Peromyscus maniculatus bairdii]|uniref:uncharacterized protein LOC143270318 n=1 Tax=Peromyscus maniculatus bairdii TaxID=230844 RepID=UPI003FD0CD0A